MSGKALRLHLAGVLSMPLMFLLCLTPVRMVAAGAAPEPPLSQYGMDTWNTADGLPQIRIRAIVQTRDGYLWLGTANGLVRFDGVNFTTFGVNTSSLKDNEIGSMVEGDDGSLWIGTYGGGLTQFKDGQFTTFTVTNGLPDNFIRKVDKDPAGNIWCATPRGVACLAKGRFTTFTTHDGLPRDYVANLCAGSAQGVFVVSGGRLCRFDNGKFVVESAAMDDSDGRMDSIASGADGALWMTFETSKIKRWLDGKVTTYTSADLKSIDRPGAVYKDPQGCIWVGVRNGLLRFQGGAFDELTTPEAQSRLGLVESIFTDREGNVWVGTEANALVRLRCVVVRILTAGDGLSDTSTRCVYQDSRGDIWIGAYLGFSRLSHGKMTAFNQMDGNPIATVTSIGEDSQGRVWIASGGRLYTMENDHLVPIPGWTSVFDIKVIARDPRGDMWIGTDGDGLYRYSDGKFTAFRVREGLANNQIRAIMGDRQGSAVWVGTTAGLSRYQDGKFTNFTVKNGMANDRVMSLCQDTNGVIWIGTRGGLIRYQNGHFFNIRESDGLPNNYVFNVLCDGAGNFWLSSGSGICHVRRSDLDALAAGKLQKVEVTTLGYRDGLRTASLVAGTQPNACADDTGKLMFCSLQGLVVASPARQAANQLIPPVYIEQVFANKEEVPVDRPLVLPPGRNELEIHYTALSFVAPEKVQFKYRLDGFDAAWVDAGARRFMHYASLPPGAYRFEVIACNNDGVWNNQGASFAFRLLPHFYQTLWFPAIVLLTLAGLAGGGYAIRIQRLQRHERELQERVDEAVAEVKVLSGLLPICSGCRKIRDDKGYWSQIESYVSAHADVRFSHSLCPDCMKRLYPDYADKATGEAKEPPKTKP